jgi:hypothetical protein
LQLDIQRHLCSKEYDCMLQEIEGMLALIVHHEVAGHHISLALLSHPPFLALPEFFLVNPTQHGKLAHVTVTSSQLTFGSVCVNTPDSVSINFDCPLLVVEESLKRHLSLLNSALSDPDWNRSELLREFYSNWLFLCGDRLSKPLLVNCSDPDLQRLDVYEPVNGQKYGIESHYVVHPSDTSISRLNDIQLSLTQANRTIAGKAIIVPIELLEPAPSPLESVYKWYVKTLQSLPNNTKTQLQQKYGQWRDKNYWVIFTAKTTEVERTWFAVKLTGKAKKALPTTSEKLSQWKLEAMPVRIFNQNNVVKRGGGNLSLSTKRVGVVGIGSVGSEIAHKLSAAGVRDLVLIDPEKYEIDNLYRHLLPQHFIDENKSAAMAYQIHRQFLWSNATFRASNLLTLATETNLEAYDMLIIAIGNPTQERFFKQYLLDRGINVSTVNCWLEGYGVGGHAVLDVAESAGCLLCAYVFPESGARGLSSNLNFIESNQVVMKSIAGCGDQFISYGAVNSAQTAIMASTLAIRYLEGKQTTSCKVSWKGPDDDALAEGVKLTHRYYQFNRSLESLPLIDEDCDICNG